MSRTHRLSGHHPVKLTPKTPEQRLAYEAFEKARREEWAFLQSPFVNAHGEQKYRAATMAAYDKCKLLGLMAAEAQSKPTWASVST